MLPEEAANTQDKPVLQGSRLEIPVQASNSQYKIGPGDSITLTETPAGHYHFVNWTGGSCNDQTGASCTFTAGASEGILWLHGYGNVFEVELKPGEQIDIEPGGWIYKDRSVVMDTIFQRLSQGFFAGAGQIFWNRFTGPGKIGLQSMYMPLVTE